MSNIDENQIHEFFMREAMREAFEAQREDEVPIGAVIVCRGEIIARAHNQREQLRDPTAHAEMIAITQAAASMVSWRLKECTLYVTLEPCPMCAGALMQARISRVVYGAPDPKAGAIDTLYHLLNDPRLNHSCETIGGVLQKECAELLSRFFQQKRQMGKK